MAAVVDTVKVERLKNDANRSLMEKRPIEAIGLYTEAIMIQPSAILHSNRAAAHLRLGRFEPAIADADAALALDGAYAKAWCACPSPPKTYRPRGGPSRSRRARRRRYRKAKAQCEDKQFDAADATLDAAFVAVPAAVEDEDGHATVAREKSRGSARSPPFPLFVNPVSSSRRDELEKLRDLVAQRRDEAAGAPSIKHFDVIEELGTGNYSSIYRAKRKSDGRVFALKLVEKSSVDKIKKRHPNVHNEVKMEKRALAKLRDARRHPNARRPRSFRTSPTKSPSLSLSLGRRAFHDVPGLLHAVLPDGAVRGRRAVGADALARRFAVGRPRASVARAVLGRGARRRRRPRPRVRPRPPRHQAGEHDADGVGARQADRFRDGQGPGGH